MRLSVAPKSLLLIQFLLFGFLLSGCGGGDDKNVSIEDEDSANIQSNADACNCTDPNRIYTGRLVGGLVEGISYHSESQSGITDASGGFQYKDGETLSFSVGGVALGQTEGAAILSALDILNVGGTGADKAINVFRLLLTLDDDSNAENGIQLQNLDQLDVADLQLDFDQSMIDFADDEPTLLLIGLVNGVDDLVEPEPALAYLTSQLASSDLFTHEATSHVYLSVNLDAAAFEPAIRRSVVTTLGDQIGVPQVGLLNGYGSETLTITYPTGFEHDYLSEENASAEDIALALMDIEGVVETEAETVVKLSGLSNDSGNLIVSINSVVVGEGDYSLASIAENINTHSSTSLENIIADEVGGILTLVSEAGEDITVSINNTGSNSDVISVHGRAGTASLLLQGSSLAGALVATVGGSVDITLAENINIHSDGAGHKLLESWFVRQHYVINDFNPDIEESYNHKTSLNILDSQSISHELTLYFVKESGINEWTAHVFVDDLDVGDPDDELSPPHNSVPRRASFDLIFNADGTLNEAASDPLQISYWNPVDDNGDTNGALQGLPKTHGGFFPVPFPVTSSNFEIFLTGSTQLGSSTDESAFEVKDVFQNGTEYVGVM